MNKIDKWSILAAVRFILASIVAIKHLDDFVPLGWMRFISGFGTFEAVIGFLLISGYSICVSYGRQPDGFLWRRILRLYPIYLAAMGLTYFTFIALKITPPDFITLAINALFLNQLVTTTSFVGPAWTLSFEFWLYCTVPLLMKVSQPRTRLLVFISFGTYLVYTAARTLFHAPYYSGVGFGANLVLLSFIWVAGFRLAKAGAKDKTAMRDIGLIFACHILLTAGIQFGSRLKHHALPSFFAHDVLACAQQSATLVFVYLVFKHLVISNSRSSRGSRILRFLGDISYPLYLMHGAVYALLATTGVKTPVLFYLSAVLVSALIYWLLDFYSQKRSQLASPLPVGEPIRLGARLPG